MTSPTQLFSLRAFVAVGLMAVCAIALMPIAPAGMLVVVQGRSGEHAFFDHLVAAAVERTRHAVRYDPAYVRIPYPGGDVPADTGVCTDEVIRAYRAVGIDLQKEVHEDM